MKKILFVVALSFTISAQCQSNDAQAKIIEPSDSTGFGTPVGKTVSKEIGSTGGTIVSDDGRIQLIFPAGALTTKTTITIQATTNPTSNGTGNAYSFEPSGIQFKKPVQIIFHYTDDEAESCAPELMGIGMQDRTGKWSFMQYDDWDSTAGILKGLIHHFSSFTNFRALKVFAEHNVLAVNGNTLVFVFDQEKAIRTGPLAGQLDFAIVRKNPVWYVNGIKNGNAKTGTISTLGADTARGRIEAGAYNAPQVLPVKNPVIVKLAVQYFSKKHKKLVWGSVQDSISIYDAYRVQIIHEFTGRAGMGSKLIDSASFSVWIYPRRLKIDAIKNYKPIVIKEGKASAFKEKINVDEALGTIQITEFIKNDSLSHDYPPEVYFEFPSYDILALKSQYSARGIKSELESLMVKSIPEEINFIANGKEQHINMTDNTTNYKLIVKPLRGD
jgi:hypothetical protein